MSRSKTFWGMYRYSHGASLVDAASHQATAARAFRGTSRSSLPLRFNHQVPMFGERTKKSGVVEEVLAVNEGDRTFDGRFDWHGGPKKITRLRPCGGSAG